MEIRYKWRADEKFYSTVVDRYYAQVALPFRLRSQAILAWIALNFPLLLIEDVDLQSKIIWFVAVTVFAIVFEPLIRWAIIFKYRLRPSFGSESTFSMNETGVTLTGAGAGIYPWTVYRRAVRFSDGILLTRPGALRWLPDSALTAGTAGEAEAFIRRKMPLRVLS